MKVLEWRNGNPRPIFEERLPLPGDRPFVHQAFDKSKIEKMLKEFY